MRRLKTVRRPPIYPKTPGHLPYSLTHPLPLSSRRPSVDSGLAERAADAGLGITVHAGEFSTANIEAALRVPGITRIGHGVHAATTPELLQRLADSGVTVECCLTSNVVLGAVPSLDEHPIRKFVDAGVPVTLSSDDPMRLCTTIAGEYEQAASLGFDESDLLSFTRNGILASFTSDDRRSALLETPETAVSQEG